MIKLITKAREPEMTESAFKFEMSNEAAEHNWSILKQHRNLGEAIIAENNSPLRYGSEFRHPKLLEPIFNKHPLWPRLKSMLEHGVQFPLTVLPYSVRKQDTIEALEFGNHKGAEENKELFESLMKKDIIHGYSLIIPLWAILEIEGALMSPLNVQDQWTINERGEVIPSKRLTHNQSKTYEASGTSINSRVIEEKLQDCMYGFMILRLIHYIVALRTKYPGIAILMQKTDYKSAYRRAHLNWLTAIQTITKINEDWGQIALRATFGGAPNPNEWGNVSESICDLANAIMNDPEWNPEELHSPFQHLIPPDNKLSDDIPFAEALPTIVSPPLAPHAYNDVYIDDDVTINLDTPENTPRARAGVLLAIHAVGRPNQEKEPITRLELPSMVKLAGEGRLEEEKVVLGWILDTRRLIIRLPDHKHKAWSQSINNMLTDDFTTTKKLETLIGRLTHLSVILNPILHFLSRLRHLHEKSTNRRKIKVPDYIFDDLHLAQHFLNKANKGVSFNLVTFRKPTRVYSADAFPWGIGGYSSAGTAWRWEIPQHLLWRATLNMLEHLASTIGPWIDLIERTLPRFSCILSQTDSTTAQGWLRKSNFMEKDENDTQVKGKRELSRDHAKRILDHDMKDYTQWGPGDHNVVSDSLSRDHHLSNSQLTALLKHFYPQQIPDNFEIRPLPTEIESWICAWLQSMPEGKPSQEQLQRSTTAHGKDGLNFLNQLESQETSTLMDSTTAPEPVYSQSLHSPSDKESIVATNMIHFKQDLVAMPWTMWHRPLGTTSWMTQDTTHRANLAAFYHDSSKAIKTRTHLQSLKKQHQSASSKQLRETNQHQDE